jgi:hypothetical protein
MVVKPILGILIDKIQLINLILTNEVDIMLSLRNNYES